MKMNRTWIFSLAVAALVAGCSKDDGGNRNADGGGKPVAPAAGTEWSTTVAKSPEGGFLMGNPAAVVKLTEYGALSCPVCGRFSTDSTEKLKEYVNKGTVSLEFRPFMVHPQDLPATLLATCNGPASFFGIAEQMFAKQQEWAYSTELTREDQERWASMQPNQVAADMAEKLKLIPFVQQRGVPEAKARQCLADPKTITALEALSKLGVDDGVEGTPTFFINGAKVENVTSWIDLEPKLRAAGA